MIAGYILPDCLKQASWADKHWYLAHGSGGHYSYVWARNPGAGHHAEPMILMCAGSGGARAHTTSSVKSVPCPVIDGYQTRPAGGGAGWSVGENRGEHWHASLFPQVTGSFGSNDDGYWHYSFMNNTPFSVRTDLFGFCRYWGHFNP